MSTKSCDNLRDEDDNNSTEIEEGQEEMNEYEMQRASRIARNNAFLQPSVDLAKSL